MELRHDLGREQLERLADVLVPVLAALLDEDRLVDAGVLEHAQVPRSSSGLPMQPAPPPSTSVPIWSRTFRNAFQMFVRPGVCLPKT